MSSPRLSGTRSSGAILLLGILVSWECVSRAALVNSVFFPPFSAVLAALTRLALSVDTWHDVGATVFRCLLGYAVACSIGIPIGIALGRSRRAYRLFEPLVEVLRPIPSAAIIPVAILFLGIDNAMKVFVVVYACLWPILLNSLDGVRSIDPVLIDTGSTFGLSRRDFMVKLVIPAASPQIVTGMRISLAIALILAITVEMIAGSNGIGFSILDAERSFRFPEMYAWIVMIGLVGYSVNSTFVMLSNRVMRWHRGFTSTLL